MTILHLSDTHNCHHRLNDLPDTDIIVHSGDFTMNGSVHEALDFIEWFCALPHPHKIFICGNHDNCLYGANINGLGRNVHYLCNSGVEISGVKFYGVPMFIGDYISGCQTLNYANIPNDTDILVTHTPPFGILDYDNNIHYGSYELLAQIKIVRPHMHLFGHIHSRHGTLICKGTTFSNGAVMDVGYSDLRVPKPLEINW